MLSTYLLLFALGTLAFGSPVLQDADGGNLWVLIVAGSNGWYNYRHQADACHAYQIVRRNGVPENRIITMMYDDIAHNRENPTPGIIINHPNGKDVYKGVKIDYKGKDVNPENFLAILSGKERQVSGGNGRVINSNSHDRVFVYFTDHGAPGLVAFPVGTLHARQLQQTIMSMHENQQYKEMVFYVEACESGSMFQDLLPDDIKVFATTAANTHESSYACYFDKKRSTFLGDVYSVKWMEDSDAEDLSTETLQDQFKIVRKETNTSHVLEFGDMNIAKEPVANFQGSKKCQLPVTRPAPEALNAVPSEQVPMAILAHKLTAAETPEEEENVLKQMETIKASHRSVMDTLERIVKISSRDNRQSDRLLGTRYKLTNFDCYEPAVELFAERCFDLSKNDYAMRHLYKIVNLCEEQTDPEIIMAAIAAVCKKD